MEGMDGMDFKKGPSWGWKPPSLVMSRKKGGTAIWVPPQKSVHTFHTVHTKR